MQIQYADAVKLLNLLHSVPTFMNKYLKVLVFYKALIYLKVPEGTQVLENVRE